MADLGSSPSSTALVARRPGESWSYTGANDAKVSHRWIIDKFPLLCHSTSKRNLKSLSFTGGGPAEWHLELDTEYGTCFEDHVSLHLSLYLDKPANTPISVECKMSILNNKRQRCKQKIAFLESIQRRGCAWEDNIIGRDELLTQEQVRAWLRPPPYLPPSHPRRRTNQATEDELLVSVRLTNQATRDELLVGDTLTILCELNILFSLSDLFTVMSSPIAPPSNNLIADLGSLLKGGLHSDVTLVAEGKEFQAHMNILSVRSSVFKAMFQHDMRESKEKKVDISDLSADTVQEMLQHIYTGEVSTLEQSTESLLEAADKYDLPSLQSACEETLRSRLKVENVAKMLMLADKYNAEQLKAECMYFIAAYPREIQESEGWKVLESKRQDLLIEIAIVLLKHLTAVP